MRAIHAWLYCSRKGSQCRNHDQGACRDGDRQPAEPHRRVAAAQHGDCAGNQQDAQRIEQQQVAVGPRGPVVGETPQVRQQRARHEAEQPQRQRHGRDHAGRATSRPRDQCRDDDACEQPGPPPARRFGRLRRDAVRQQLHFRLHQRTAGGVLRLAQAVGQAHRHVAFLPARHRLVCRRAEAHVEAQPHPRRRRGKPHGFAAEGVSARTARKLRFQRAAECGIQRVADLGGTVGGEVVVAIACVFRPRAFGQRVGQRLRLVGPDIEPLDRHAAAAVAVLRQVLLERQRDQVVHHVAAREVADEVGFGWIEEAEVVRDGVAAGRIHHDDGVVAEALEEHLAGLHGRHADARRRPCRGGQQPQRAQQRQARDRATHPPVLRHGTHARGAHRPVPPGTGNGPASVPRRLRADGRWRR